MGRFVSVVILLSIGVSERACLAAMLRVVTHRILRAQVICVIKYRDGGELNGGACVAA